MDGDGNNHFHRRAGFYFVVKRDAELAAAMLIFDAHLDLAMNALEWNRDLRRPLDDIRQREKGLTDKPDRGNATVSLPEMRRGGIGLCVTTQIARHVKPGNPLPGWHSPEQAWAQTQGQLAWYRAMEEDGQMVQIKDAAGLARHWQLWQAGVQASADSGAQNREVSAPIGYILSLEGADSIITLKHLERSYAQGLRAVGPAHYGPGTYAQGTDATGGLGQRGRELLKEMEGLGIILDVTHLCDESFWEALDHFQGRIWASHSNCRTLVPHNRQFSEEQIKVLIERGAVIGGALDAWMLMPGWVRGKTSPDSAGLKLERFVDHIDYICQLAGNARHCGIGSDLDGAFGREQTPADLETIADLPRLVTTFSARNYGAEHIDLIMHGNFVRFLREAWA
jgi:membrane dipeptidase